MSNQPTPALSPRELDAALAERLFGHRPGKWVDRICINGTWRDGRTWMYADEDPANPGPGASVGMMPARCSSTGDGMLKVLASMREKGYHFEIRTTGCAAPGSYRGEFARAGEKRYEGYADTLPLAVSLAALQALEAEASTG